MMRKALESRLRVALRNVVVDEFSLFVPWVSGRPASEIAVCAQLARHLGPQFSRTWDVDCEYNRAGTSQPKQTDDGERHPADLIVHRRTGGGIGNNLLIAEVKVSQASKRVGGSERSLSALVETYHYRHGILLYLDCKQAGDKTLLKPKWKWFGSEPDSAFQLVFTPSTLDSILAEAMADWDFKKERLRHPDVSALGC